MTTSHLISYLYFSLLGNVDTNSLIYTWRKFISIFSCKHFCIYYNTKFTVRDSQRGISYFSGFFAENSTEQSLFCCQFCLSLWCYFSYQNISGTNLSTNADDSLLIQIFQCVITHARYISCNLFCTKFGISCFCFIFINVYGCIYIFLHQTLTQKNSILVVVTFPGHKSDQRVLSKSNLSAGSRWSVCDNLSFFNFIAFCHDWSLVHTGTLVASYKLSQFVLIHIAIFLTDNDPVGFCSLNHTGFFCRHTVS